MVDADAVNLVKEALKSGKSEKEVIALMKQAGYADQSIADVLAEVRGGASPADELARRIAVKNNIPVQPNLPRLGPRNLPSQPPAMQPMSAPKFKKTYKIILIALAAIVAAVVVLWFLFPSMFSFS